MAPGTRVCCLPGLQGHLVTALFGIQLAIRNSFYPPSSSSLLFWPTSPRRLLGRARGHTLSADQRQQASQQPSALGPSLRSCRPSGSGAALGVKPNPACDVTEEQSRALKAEAMPRGTLDQRKLQTSEVNSQLALTRPPLQGPWLRGHRQFTSWNRKNQNACERGIARNRTHLGRAGALGQAAVSLAAPPVMSVTWTCKCVHHGTYRNRSFSYDRAIAKR